MKVAAQLKVARCRCPRTLKVNFEPQWRASVEVPDFHPVTHPVPRRPLASLEKEVNRGAGLISPRLPVVATLRMRLEGKGLKHGGSVHTVSMFCPKRLDLVVAASSR